MSDATPARTRPMVKFLSLVACNKCRRRRGAQLHATGRVEAVPIHGTCPHGKPLRTIWAAGEGPQAARERAAEQTGLPEPWDRRGAV